jgi:hypothetical protein
MIYVLCVMRITFHIPDETAQEFVALVPSRSRSKMVTKLIKEALDSKRDRIAKACRAANKDELSNKVINDWQGFDETIDGNWN